MFAMCGNCISASSNLSILTNTAIIVDTLTSILIYGYFSERRQTPLSSLWRCVCCTRRAPLDAVEVLTPHWLSFTKYTRPTGRYERVALWNTADVVRAWTSRTLGIDYVRTPQGSDIKRRLAASTDVSITLCLYINVFISSFPSHYTAVTNILLCY